MSNIFRCQDCKHSQDITIEDPIQEKKHYIEDLECKLGYKIGVGGIPIENCKFEPK
jgi:hypothetical protein